MNAKECVVQCTTCLLLKNSTIHTDKSYAFNVNRALLCVSYFRCSSVMEDGEKIMSTNGLRSSYLGLSVRVLDGVCMCYKYVDTSLWSRT